MNQFSHEPRPKCRSKSPSAKRQKYLIMTTRPSGACRRRDATNKSPSGLPLPRFGAAVAWRLHFVIVAPGSNPPQFTMHSSPRLAAGYAFALSHAMVHVMRAEGILLTSQTCCSLLADAGLVSRRLTKPDVSYWTYQMFHGMLLVSGTIPPQLAGSTSPDVPSVSAEIECLI